MRERVILVGSKFLFRSVVVIQKQPPPAPTILKKFTIENPRSVADMSPIFAVMIAGL